ncbi:MAG: methyltransferase domain-containing protein, partial [Candidatus Binataceae bacterium]
YYKQHWIDVDSERHQAYDQILAFHPALEPLLKPLELKPGLSVLDVGSGPGHTTLELARRVGPGGRVVGVDINGEFVRRSSERARTEQLPAEFVESPFPPLKFADSTFDRVFCKNVLEYVDSAAVTVAEMARVAAKNGIVVAIDSDWDMIALDVGGAARERSDRVLAAAKSIAIKEPKIGRLLYGLFLGAGLKDVKVDIMAGADTQGRSLPMLRASLARYALDSGRVAPADVSSWLDDIHRAMENRTFLFALPQFVVRGIKR